MLLERVVLALWQIVLLVRLNQLGKYAYVVGESTTPSITSEDLFVIISGSGKTEHLKLLADKAKSVGAEVVLMTTSPNSPSVN